MKNRSQNFWDSMDSKERKDFGRYRWNLKSEEEKEIIANRFFEGSKNYRESLTQEDIKNQVNKMNNARKKLFDNDEDFRNKQIKLLRENNEKYWANISREEREIINNKIREGLIETWKNKSNEELKQHRQRSIDYWNNLSSEEKEFHRQRAINWWNDLNKIEKNEWKEKQSNGLKKYYENLNENPNKLESLFIEDLNKYNIKYQWQYCNTIKHPKFDELFPYFKFPIWITSWEHWWDFIIYTKRGNILVDVDGSIHIANFSKNYQCVRISNLEYQRFNDNKRPYQTDGLDAYVILAYNDKIEYDTKVIYIKEDKSYEYMTYKDLLNILIYSNM